LKGYKQLTEAQRLQVLETYQQTLSTRRTADMLDVSLNQVRYLLKAEGIELSNSRLGACYDNIDLVRELAAQGVSNLQIAQRVGTSPKSVHDFLERHQIERTPFVQTGENNPCWRGGCMAEGYVKVHKPDHPYANQKGHVFEHRLVMEAHLGRYLSREEVVHHIDGNRSNNRLENLRLYVSNYEHMKVEHSVRPPRSDRPKKGQKQISIPSE